MTTVATSSKKLSALRWARRKVTGTKPSHMRWRRSSTSAAKAGYWDTTLRTDTEALTKKKLEYNAKNLNDFDAVMFYTGGDAGNGRPAKADFLSFIHDDGKGFIGVHSATITFTHWPEYGEMIGGYFDEHPWGTFDAPIIVEDPSFPGMQQFPREFDILDEIYQVKIIHARSAAC